LLVFHDQELCFQLPALSHGCSVLVQQEGVLHTARLQFSNLLLAGGQRSGKAVAVLLDGVIGLHSL
jgi:hypothetical protein